MQQIPPAAPLLVWDSTGAWSRTFRDLVRVRTLQDLAALVIADLRGQLPRTFRVAYVGPVDPEHFETFCRLAWVWIRIRRGNHLVIEELSDVTSPGKAPRSWGEICRKNRYQGGLVFAITQRPAESDKTILGNCALIHCGRMNTKRDRLYMAEVLDVPVEDVLGLQDLDYIHRDMRSHACHRGRVHSPNVK